MRYGPAAKLEERHDLSRAMPFVHARERLQPSPQPPGIMTSDKGNRRFSQLPLTGGSSSLGSWNTSTPPGRSTRTNPACSPRLPTVACCSTKRL